MESTSERKVSSASAIANDRKRVKIDDHAVTGAGEITLRQSIVPVCLVTVLFFMWGFAYGLLVSKGFERVT
jgi:FHS family L-fucose permease-like MFS transporter